MMGIFVQLNTTSLRAATQPIGYVLTEAGCHEWVGSLNNQGYPQVRHQGRTVLAHRYYYEQEHGPIPPELELDHRCRNPKCVNPAHLEPVSHRTNVLRGQSGAAAYAARTHCPKGHELSGDNISAWWWRNYGARQCLICYNERRRARYHDRARAAGLPDPVPPALRTHCPHGHEYTPENTYYHARGGRYCGECSRQASARWRAAHRGG